jgi:hypothetical protein
MLERKELCNKGTASAGPQMSQKHLGLQPGSSRRERKKLAQDKPYPERSEGEEQSWEKNQ